MPKARVKKNNKKTKEKENDEEQQKTQQKQRRDDKVVSKHGNNDRTVGQGPMYMIMSNAQLNETFHKRYIKELKQLYSGLDHDAFMFTFIKMFKTVLEAEETNEYGNTALAFCAKFVTSFESEKTHPILDETFIWLLSTISNSPHVRYRLCFFVNLILKHLGPNAALDDTQCDQILHYMLDRLKDVAPSVRKQAVLAMQRLQMPDNPSDPVVCAYQYHLSTDPSSTVRQCVISCMGRNFLTVPHILQRLWDVDEKVRRHTYINMCNYPVRSYKVLQRLTILERGLNDSSDSVRKNVIKYTLKTWIEAYQHNYIQLIAALKLDSSEEELSRFRQVVRQMLFVIFEQHENSDLLAQLPLSEDCELHCCVPQDQLTVEVVLYWQYLSAYLQQTEADEYEQVLPELSVFCDYVKKFCLFQKPDIDKFQQMEFQCMLLSLVEILQNYDLGDEIGRSNLKELITHLLKECNLEPKIVSVLVRCMEQIENDLGARMQYFIEIIYEFCELNAMQNDLVHDRNLIDKLLGDVDTSLVMKINSLKVKILELEELEENFVRQKEYHKAKVVSEEQIIVTEEYTELIQPLLEKHGVLDLPTRPKLSKQERVLKGLYISYHMVASEHTNKLNPNICKLYKDFICRHLASTEMDILEWAMKCGTAFSMLYESYTKEVFDVLVEQFYKDNNIRLCATSAQCVFDLMDHYGVDYFIDLSNSVSGQAPKSKRRLLYTMQDFYDGEEDRNHSQCNEGADIIGTMGFFVERVVDKGILLAIVRGLCRLVLRGQIDNRSDVLEKLFKRYFNPTTEPIVSQVLGMFFENIVEQKKQSLLQPCLLPIVWSIMNCNFDSPLHDVQPDHVTRFFIDLTVQETSTPQNNIHNQFAMSFLLYIQNYYTERKEMCRLLAKDLTSLKLNVLNNTQLKDEMHELADKLIASELEPRMVRHLTDFKDMLNGSFNPPARKPDGNDSGLDGEECESVAATVASASEFPAEAPTASETEPTTDATTETAPQNATTVEAPPVEPILTTYGTNNEVGIRFLRRSLHNSISHSEADSICSSQAPMPEPEPVEKEQKSAEVSEITRRNLRRRETKERLEQAIARASKTPEKRPETPVEESSEDTELSLNTTIISNHESPVQNDSEVIEDSPTAPNSPNASHQRLRSMRSRNTTGARKSPAAGSKPRKVLHLEIQTPLRNGRKRVLRKSLRATPAATHSQSQSSDSATPAQRISPMRKQQRLDTKTPSRKQSRSSRVHAVASKEKVTDSPTGSSTSSIKENTMPPAIAIINSTPQASSRRSLNRSHSSPPSSRITRHSARKLIVSAMRMTRKRMSQEMNLSLSEPNLKTNTPKRQRPDKLTRTKSSGSEQAVRATRSATKPTSTSTVTTRMRTNTPEAVAVITRTRRK